MEYRILKETLEKEVKDRYQLMKERIYDLEQDACASGKYKEYVKRQAQFLQKIFSVYETDMPHRRTTISREQLIKWNADFYQDIKEPQYQKSYANPDVTQEAFGHTIGQYLSFLVAELRALIPGAYCGDVYSITIYTELFAEIVTLMEQQETDDVFAEELRRAIYDFEKDYSEIVVHLRLQNQLDSDMDFATRIVMDSDLSQENYLYYYGEYIGRNEIESARYLNSFSQEAIEAMAATWTEGYRKGFAIAGIDLSEKKTVNIRYPIGFERIIRAAIQQFAAMGLRPSIYPMAAKSLNKRRNLKIGYTATSPNRQYDYDHRFDYGLYLDKAFAERKLEVLSAAYEDLKEKCQIFAGPACMETFGEQEYEPVTKDSAVRLTQAQQQIDIRLQSESGKLANQYIPHDQYSFTIIAYPVPEIGNCYEDIFRETVAVNTLDNEKYQKIQQVLIDALDQAESVRVKGCNGNRTDITVMLHEKTDAQKETNFENCLADVNIPVGEVFTSPRLTGTHGVLHVSSAYLNDLQFKQLQLVFEDGMIKTYSVENFSSEEENQRFVKENLLNHRDTLPIGEFAIGTNTTAYVMARKYHIVHQLPILIVEKMGPHFAVGDTCYSHSEEVRLFNPDGKEIVAKENECSVLRTVDSSKAYFNCHTDITIPYDEIGSITAIRPDGSEIPIIANGRFVLEGTLELNVKDM